MIKEEAKKESDKLNKFEESPKRELLKPV